MVASGSSRRRNYTICWREHTRKAGGSRKPTTLCATATRIDPQDESNYLDLMLLCLEHENWDLSLEISRNRAQSDSAGLQSAAPTGRGVRAERPAGRRRKRVPGGHKGGAQSEPALCRACAGANRAEKLAEAIAVLRARRTCDSKDYLVNWILAEAITQGRCGAGFRGRKRSVSRRSKTRFAQIPPRPSRGRCWRVCWPSAAFTRATREFEAALEARPERRRCPPTSSRCSIKRPARPQRAEELFAKVGKARAEDPEAIARRATW